MEGKGRTGVGNEGCVQYGNLEMRKKLEKELRVLTEVAIFLGDSDWFVIILRMPLKVKTWQKQSRLIY